MSAKHGSARPAGGSSAGKSVEPRGLRVVAIGGGTGLSTLLKGLKVYTHLPGTASDPAKEPSIAELCAVVTVSDDGGSSGRLRKEFNKML